MILTIHSPGRKKFVGDRDLGKKATRARYPLQISVPRNPGHPKGNGRLYDERRFRSIAQDRQKSYAYYLLRNRRRKCSVSFLSHVSFMFVCVSPGTYLRAHVFVSMSLCVCTTWSIEKKSFDRPNGRRDRSIAAFVRSFVCILFEKSRRHDRSIDRSRRPIEKIDPRSSRKGFIQDFGWYFWSIGQTPAFQPFDARKSISELLVEE